MNTLDIICLIPIAWAAFKGFQKGLIIGLTTLVALFLGIYGAMYFNDPIEAQLLHWFDINNEYLPIITLVSTFLIIVIIVHLIGKTIEKFVELISLKFMDRLLGSIFSILKTALILAIIFFLIEKVDIQTDILNTPLKKESVFYYPLINLIGILFGKYWSYI